MNRLNFRKKLEEVQPTEEGLVFENHSLRATKEPFSVKKIWHLSLGEKKNKPSRQNRKKRWKRIERFANRYRLFEDHEIRTFIYQNKKEIKASIKPSAFKHAMVGLVFLPLWFSSTTMIMGACGWIALALLFRQKAMRQKVFEVNPKQQVEVNGKRYARLIDERAARHAVVNGMGASRQNPGLQSKKYEKGMSEEKADWFDLRWLKIEEYAETKCWAERWSRYGKIHLRERDLAFLYGVTEEFEDFLTPRKTNKTQEWVVWMLKEGGRELSNHLEIFKQRIPEVQVVEVRQNDDGVFGVRLVMNTPDAEMVHHFWQDAGTQERASVYIKNYEETRARCFWDCHALPWN